MNRGKLGIYLFLWTVGAAMLHGNPKCAQDKAVVKLPLMRAWRVALGCAETERQKQPEPSDPRAGIERAWRSYLEQDILASRVELAKWLPDLLEHGEIADVALALSVVKLGAAAGARASQPATATSLADDLTQARPKWREERSLGSWVDLFDGEAAERRKATQAAERNWTAAANAKDAPSRVQGLAHLGLAQLAIGRKSGIDALAHLQAAESAFVSEGDTRGVAAVMILRVAAFSASHDAAKTDSAAAAAESYCRAQGLADGVVETLLAASDGAAASGDSPKAARAWTRAEDEALHSGLMAIRVLNRAEMVRLKQYAGADLTLEGAREFFRWAAEVGNLVLIERSSRAMAAALKRTGQTGASGWYGVMADDAAAMMAQLPASTRLLHAALIDYGLLEVGVDPGSIPELFVGNGYTAFSKDRIGGIGRILKLTGDDSAGWNAKAAEVQRLAKLADQRRESALAALRRTDRKSAEKELAEFFQSVTPVMERLAELATEVDGDKKAADNGDEPKMIYAAGLLNAWSTRDPNLLRGVLSQLQEAGTPVHVPLLLPAGDSAKPAAAKTAKGGARSSAKGRTGKRVVVSSDAPDSEALGVAVARGQAAKGRSWPRLVARYAAAGGGSAVTAAAFGVDPEQLNEQEAAQFQIAYAGQFALAANRELPHVQLGGQQPFESLLRKMGKNSSVYEDIEKASKFGFMLRVMQMAYLSTELGATRLAKTKFFQSIIGEEPDMPDFDSLDENEESGGNDAKGDAAADQGDAPPKGFGRGFAFAVWSFQFPVLLNAVVSPYSDSMEKAMLGALADMTMNPSGVKGSVPPEMAPYLGQIESTRRLIVLDLALSALAGRRYGDAIRRLSNFEAMMPSGATLERVQIKYVRAMCYRGLGDALHETALLKAAGEDLESLRRSVATRSASLRLRDLRQLIQEEYLSALYRQGDWSGMARAIAAYRLASVLPAAVLAAAPRHRLAQELETLKDTYQALAAGTESPVTRQDYRGLFKLFQERERLPSGDPTLNAIEQATYLVTNELYAETPRGRRGVAVIRPAAPGELLILQSVGHTGVHTVTIDEHGRTSGYYRYLPIASLEALCQEFEKALQAEDTSSKAGAQLYGKLLAYLPEMKGKRRLSILADGPLQNLAWAALPAENGRYLIENYEIGISSGAKPASAGSAPLPQGQILAITNPDADAAGAGQLTAIAGGVRSGIIPLEGAAANLPNIQRALARAEAVYISTHGQSDYLRPDYSFLELTGGKRLYSLDLEHLDFSGRRLLLSACETRTGKTYGGEDVYGLADAFLARNASTVVATRWRVEAPAAAAFSAAFYESQRAGADYTAAASQAARSLLKGQRSEWRAARHWAAYEPVTRFFDRGRDATQLRDSAGSLDAGETARITGVLQDARKRAELERQQLTDKEAALNAELTELGKKVTLEEDTNYILSSQALTGRRTEKWIAAALKSARTALEANPEWKPPERLQLTIRVKDGSKAAVPGAVVLVQDISRGTQTAQSTDAGGRAVFPDMRAGAAYHIDVSAKGFVREVAYNEDAGALDAWLADAEKVIPMRRVNDTAKTDEDDKLEPKPAEKKSAARKPQPVLARLAGPLRALLGEIDTIEASNDTTPARIAALEAEQPDAQHALERKTEEHQTYIKEINEIRTKLDQESRELNAILRQAHLTELQPQRFEISGTVDDTHFKGIRAKVTLQRVGAVEETTSSDESGHFVFAGAKPGVEYVVAAEAEGHTAWKSLPITFYFPCSFSISLDAPEDSAYRRRFWL